jgi:gluconate 5-dehydrogenase
MPSGGLFDLTDRIAVVTGATRGLGLEMARGLARAGAIVYINGRDPLRTADVAKAENCDRIRPLPFDVHEEAAVARSFGELACIHGRLDVLVSNVGVRLRESIDYITPALFHAHLGTNLTAPYALAREAARHMISQQRGRIIMITSTAATLGIPGDAAYIAAKGGLTSLTRALACEYGKYAITCNAICPGPFATETNAAVAAGGESSAMVRRRTILGRWGKPSEIAGACVFLASDEAAYVTGSVLTVDGGFTASL